VLITFDDACRDFGEIAWPILRRHALPATVFVPTAFPDDAARTFWWDRLHRAVAASTVRAIQVPGCGALRIDSSGARRASMRRLFRAIKAAPHVEGMALVEHVCRQLGNAPHEAADVLTWRELKELAADGVTLGAHTRTHPALTRLPLADAREEIRASRDDLARLTGTAPALFAYPFGDHDEGVAAAVRDAGFAAAVTCLDGHNQLAAVDPYRLSRTNVTTRTTTPVFSFRLTAGGARFDAWRHRPSRGADVRPDRLPSRPDRAAVAAPRVAYVMSRFPKLSETFVLNEMNAVVASGTPVELYPLLRERQHTTHPEVAPWMGVAHFHPFVSAAIVRTNVTCALRHPAAYGAAFMEALGKTWGSPRLFVGAIGILPKAVRFAHEMSESGVTHVHAHFATHPALAALVVHRLTGIPFSFTAHGSDLHVDQRMLDTKLDAAAFAVTVSEFNKGVMVRASGEWASAKIRVIPCGVDPEYFRPADDPLPGGPFRFVCVASFEEVKGHRFLVDACRVLRDRGLEFDLDLVGEGPRRPSIERQVDESGLRGHVHFLGGQPRPEIARLLRNAHAAVLASHPTRDGRREGIPVALMEAMATGLPVVATAISGIPELVRSDETGLLVPSGDPLALADALDRLVRDPALRARLGTAARTAVCRDFHLHTNAQRLAALFSNGTRAPHPRAAERAAALLAN